MTGQKKKKPRYSSESPWFPEYYIGWIGIGNCGQKTSNMEPVCKFILQRVHIRGRVKTNFYAEIKKINCILNQFGRDLKAFPAFIKR